MDTEKVYTTSLRLYKNRPVHHQAYRYLKEYNYINTRFFYKRTEWEIFCSNVLVNK